MSANASTVGELRELISRFPADTPVVVHEGWDFEFINTCDFDPRKSALVLFLDTPQEPS